MHAVDIMTHYDVFLLDAYGVLYDNNGPLPGVIHAINTLHQNQKPVFIITNNSGSSPTTIAHDLHHMGIAIPPHHILSSGDGLAWCPSLRQYIDHKACFVVGSCDSHYYITQAGGHIIDKLTMADTIVLTMSGDDLTLYDAVIAHKHQNPDCPIICINPDHYVQTGDKKWPVIGYFAQSIVDQTGHDILWMGKPYSNFSEVVRTYLTNQGYPHPDSTWLFIDDNYQNLMTLTHDLGIHGAWPTQTGLAVSTKPPPPSHTIHRIDRFGLLET